jgi:hypothetical protein
LKERIKRFDLYSVLIDESTDVAGQSQLSVFIRFINENIKPETVLLGLKTTGNEGTNSPNLLRLLLELLSEWELNPYYIVGVGSDGANNMSGTKGGLIGLLREKYLYSIHFHCAAHRLNLVLQDSLEGEPMQPLREIKNDINSIAVFINSSAKRRDKLKYIQKAILNKKTGSVKLSVDIRWSSFYNCLHSVIKQIESIKILMNEEAIIDDTKLSSQLLESINNDNFLIHSVLLHTVLAEVNKTIIFFQTENLSISSIFWEINSLKARLESLKNCKVFYDKLITSIPFSKRKKKPSFKTMKMKNESLLLLYINNIIKSITQKYPEDISYDIMKLFDPVNLKNVDWNELLKTYKRVIEQFSKFFIEKRFSEYEDDFWLYKKLITAKIKKYRTFEQICSYVITKPSFSDAITLVRLGQIGLLLPPTTVAVECGFSEMNIKKNKQSNKMGEYTLNALLGIKINQKFCEAYLDLIIEKAAKNWIERKNRRGLLTFENDIELLHADYNTRFKNEKIKNKFENCN